jgi:hypothetical protein
MRRAEEKAARAARPLETPNDHIARTRNGCVVRRDGSILTPGPLYDRDQFNALPLID